MVTMSRLPVVAILLLMTPILSLVLVVSRILVVFGTVCYEYRCYVITIARIIIISTRHASSVLHPLNIDQLTWIYNSLSPSAAGHRLHLIIANITEYLFLLFRFLRAAFCACIAALILFCTLLSITIRFAFRRAHPHLYLLGPGAWILLDPYVYNLLYGIFVLVFHFSFNDDTPNTRVKHERNSEPELKSTPFRRRKPMRIQLERYKREREEAMQQASKRVLSFTIGIPLGRSIKPDTCSNYSSSACVVNSNPPNSSTANPQNHFSQDKNATSEPTSIINIRSHKIALHPMPSLLPATLMSSTSSKLLLNKISTNPSNPTLVDPSASTVSPGTGKYTLVPVALKEHQLESICLSKDDSDRSITCKPSAIPLLSTLVMDMPNSAYITTSNPSSSVEPVDASLPEFSAEVQTKLLDSTTVLTPSVLSSSTFSTSPTSDIATPLTAASSPEAVDYALEKPTFGHHAFSGDDDLTMHETSFELKPGVVPTMNQQENALHLNSVSNSSNALEDTYSAPTIQSKTLVNTAAIPTSQSVPPFFIASGPDNQHVVQSELEVLAERMGSFDSSSEIVQDFLTTPGVAAFIEAAAAELDLQLGNGVIDNSPLWTNSQIPTVETTLPDVYSNSNPSVLNELSDTAWAAAEDDIPYMSPEQVELILKQLDVKLVEPEDDLAGVDSGLCCGAYNVVTSPGAAPASVSVPILPEDTGLQALDAVWISMGIDPTKPGFQDLGLSMMIQLDPMEDSAESVAKAYLESNAVTPGDYAPTTSFFNPLTATNLDADVNLDMSMPISDEDCIAALERLCLETSSIDFSNMVPAAGSIQQSSMDLSLILAPDDGGRDVAMSDEDCLSQLEEFCKEIVPVGDLEVDLEHTLAMLGGLAAQTDAGFDFMDTSAQASISNSAGSSGCMQLEDILNPDLVFNSPIELNMGKY